MRHINKKIKQIKINYETQFSINILLNNKIEKKIFKKNTKNNVSKQNYKFK